MMSWKEVFHNLPPGTPPPVRQFLLATPGGGGVEVCNPLLPPHRGWVPNSSKRSFTPPANDMKEYQDPCAGASWQFP